jgi:hypothetical protein
MTKSGVWGVWPSCSLLLAALLGGCGAMAPKQVAVEYGEWAPAPNIHGLRVKTDHYEIRTTVRDRELIECVPAFMETAFAEYRRVLQSPAERPERLVTYLFETRPEWDRFTRAFVPQRADMYLRIREGGYMDYPTATTVAYDLTRDRTLALLAHEGWHQYLAGYFPEPVVAWLDEGMACQWEAFDLKGGRPVFASRQNLFRRNNLRDALTSTDRWIPLKRLVEMNAGQAVAETGSMTRSYYAQVWALVLFLKESRNTSYTRGFAKLLADAGTRKTAIAVSGYRLTTPGSEGLSQGEILFRHYIVPDLDAFEKEFIVFSRELVK